MDPKLTQCLPKNYIFGICGIFFYLIMDPKIGFKIFSENILMSKYFGTKLVKSEKKIRQNDSHKKLISFTIMIRR